MRPDKRRRPLLAVSPGYPPHSIAGTEQHVRGLVEALRDSRDLRVLCRDGGAAGGAAGIASDLGGLPEAVEDGVNGLLFRAGDAADLTEKMRRGRYRPCVTSPTALRTARQP